MKKALSIVTALVFSACASTAFSTILVQENFNYTAGSVSGVATNGTGLTGNWYAGAFRNTANTASVFQSSSLTLAGHFASSGGSLQLTNAGGDFSEGGASAAVSATLSGNAKLFTSSIMKFESGNGSFFSDWTTEQRFNSTISGDFSTAVGRNIVRAFNSGSGAAGKGGVSSNGSEVAQATGTNNAGTNYLFVTRYTVASGNVTQATIYVFDAAAYANYLIAATPANAEALLDTHALYTLTDNDSQSLSSFSFLQFTTQGGPIGSFDDFRLGTDITDVVNVSAIPEPSTFAALAGVAVFALSAVRRRRA